MPTLLARLAAPVLIVSLSLVASTPVRANLMLTVASSTAAAGGTGSFDVVLSSLVTDPTYTISGFSVELGVAASSGVKFTAATVATAAPYIFGTLQSSPFSFSSFPTTDFIASDADMASPGYVSLAPGMTYGLEHVTYSVAPGTTAGPITVIILGQTGPAPTTQIDDANGNPTAFAPTSGTILVAPTVTTPEPSSFCLMAIALAVGAGASRLRRG